ncbi:MAG: C4-dicarboxylate ABC transporter, partial [Dehalococcoidia bacterium]|nr:C4-dicarboxylate ABC transporter [Dehalococcoidia bacterium]
FEAMLKLKAKGVTSVRWSDADLAILSKAWDEVRVEMSASDPLFKEINESYSAFRAKYKVWKDHGYLN